MNTGTDLYERVVNYDYGIDGRGDLMTKVWKDVPWMVDAFTGSCDSARDSEMREWCREKFGPEHWPIHGKPGLWQRGGATIYGWTWYGFATEAMMREFMAAWPTPDEMKPGPIGSY